MDLTVIVRAIHIGATVLVAGAFAFDDGEAGQV
jgi:hypothetical protein